MESPAARLKDMFDCMLSIFTPDNARLASYVKLNRAAGSTLPAVKAVTVCWDASVKEIAAGCDMPDITTVWLGWMAENEVNGGSPAGGGGLGLAVPGGGSPTGEAPPPAPPLAQPARHMASSSDPRIWGLVGMGSLLGKDGESALYAADRITTTPS